MHTGKMGEMTGRKEANVGRSDGGRRVMSIHVNVIAETGSSVLTSQEINLASVSAMKLGGDGLITQRNTQTQVSLSTVDMMRY